MATAGTGLDRKALAGGRPGVAATLVDESPLKRRRVRMAWTFLAPMLVALSLVALWPLARTVYYSFTDARLSSLETYAFVGLDNYLYLLQDPQWWRAVWNTLFFTVVSVSLETLLGIVIALTLNAYFPGRGLLRAAVLIPWAIPTVVSAKMWGWMYHDLYGVLNAAFLWLGLISKPQAWIADPQLAMAAVIAVDVWKTTPFMALLTLAALQLIPGELYEAGRIDGVNRIQAFFKITLPLIRPALMVAIIFRALDAMRIFDLIFVLTGNNQDTASMSVYTRQQLVDFQDFGFGSTASTLLFLIIALATAITITLGKVSLSPNR